MKKKTEIDTSEVKKPMFSSITIRELVEDYYDRGNGPLNLSPKFQRNSVWKIKDRSLLIDTIIHRYPLPAIVLACRKDFNTGEKVLDVIDGKQRIETILLYLGELLGRNLKDKRFEAKLPCKTGERKYLVATWEQLDEDTQKVFWEYKIPVVTIDGHDMDYVCEVFVRVNTTGKALSRSEVRNARAYDDPFLNRMVKFSGEMFKVLLDMEVLSETDGERMRDVELLSELVLSVYEEKPLDKKRNIDRIMSRGSIDMRSVGLILRRVKSAIRLVRKVGIEGTRFCKISDFYSLVMVFDKLQHEGYAVTCADSLRNAGEVLRKFGLKVDHIYEQMRKFDSRYEPDSEALEYVDAVRSNGDCAQNRRTRERVLMELLEGVFAKKDKDRYFNEFQRRIIWGASKEPRCSRCGCKLKWSDFQVDHVKAHSKGGKTVLANGKLICRECNASKGNRW